MIQYFVSSVHLHVLDGLSLSALRNKSVTTDILNEPAQNSQENVTRSRN